MNISSISSVNMLDRPKKVMVTLHFRPLITLLTKPLYQHSFTHKYLVPVV